MIRTSLSKDKLDANATVAAYKSLANVERAFRSMKTVDLNVRPIFHYTEQRVRAHVFLCMLAVSHDRRAMTARTQVDHQRMQISVQEEVLSLTVTLGERFAAEDALEHRRAFMEGFR